MRAACGWGVEEGWLPTMPFSAARAGATKVPRRSKVPEMDEIRRVIDTARGAADLRAAVGVRLVVVTGMRAAEVAGLRWDGVDVESGRIHIAGQASQHRRGYRVGTKYRGLEGRTVTVDAATIAALVEYRASLHCPTEWVLGADGDPLPPDARWLTARWRRYAEAAGVPAGRKDGYVLHDLRHAAASHALDAGVPVTAVAERLGQSPAVTLAVYAQAIRGAEQAAGDALAKRLDTL